MLGQVRINPGATLLYHGKSPFNLYYRPLHPADFDALKAIHRDLFPIDYEEVFFRKAVTGEDRVFSWAAVHQDTFGREHIVGFVAARLVYMYECDPVDRRVMGLGGKLHDSAMGVYVLTLGVVAGCRKCGIAQQLLTFVQRHAESMRCRTVFLHVISYNDAAMRLYNKAGYTAMARLPNFYHLVTGRQPNPEQCWYDAFLYAALLPPPVPEPSPALQWAGGVLGAAVAPLRSVLGTFHGCMPTWLCRQTYNTFSPFATRPVSGAGSHTFTTVKTCPPELMPGSWPPPPPPPPPARYPHTYPQPPPPPSPFQRQQQQQQQQQTSSGPYGQSIAAPSHSCSPAESGSQQHSQSQSQPPPPKPLSSSSSVGSGGPQGENGYSCGWGPGSNGSGPPPPPPPPPEPPVALHPPTTPVRTGHSPSASSLQQRHPHGTGSGTGSGGGGGCGIGYPAQNSGSQHYHPNQLYQLQQQQLYIQHADKAQYQHQYQQHIQMQGQLAYVSSVGGSGSSGGQYSQPHGHNRYGEHSRGGIPRGQGPGGLPSHAQSYSSSHHHHHPHPRYSDRQPASAFSSTSSTASSLLSSLFRPPGGAEAHPHSR